MLNWANQFNICCFLDSHQYDLGHSSIECVMAAGCYSQVSANAGKAFGALQQFIDTHPGEWLFGHLGYDLKNETEGLQSTHPDGVGFPDLFFFVPEMVVILTRDTLSVGAEYGHESIAAGIFASDMPHIGQGQQVKISTRFTREEYIEAVQQIQQYILRGDCYELNFCQEFFCAAMPEIKPADLYYALCQESPNPFAAYYRLQNRYLLCASPERYLKKTGSTLIAQPIKGTSSRYRTNVAKDAENKEALKNSTKDRAENVMIVDLVRNDLSKICREASVQVEELMAVYSFPQVHQMISTIRGEVNAGTSVSAILKAAFPMGSMTGAPKRRVMELIETYEKTKRGLFAGAVGYINPQQDFDFNVVIRSILYNSDAGYLSFQAGSAITYHSQPEKEYEECMLKAAAIRKIIGAEFTQ